MLFSSFEDKTTVNLCRDAHHERAGVGAFRQRPGDRLAGCSQIGQHVTHDIGQTLKCFAWVGLLPPRAEGPVGAYVAGVVRSNRSYGT